MESFKYELNKESTLVINPSNFSLIILSNTSCSLDDVPRYLSVFGIYLAVPEWEAIVTAIVLSIIILVTVIGNILVILSVFTYKPLRIVQNFFIVSLAVADLTVAILVLPFNIAYSILGRWVFGIHFCKMWLTCDILCCTSSILNLCSIALDRYWAITDPINYAQKRTLNRVLLMICGVWVLSLIISSPPLLGWNDWPDEFSPDTPCQLTSQQGYVIYSSLGSFYIPLFIMTMVYLKIFVATRRRLRERAKATKMNTVASINNRNHGNSVKETYAQDQESVSSETNINDSKETHSKLRIRPKKKNKKKKMKSSEKSNAKLLTAINNEDSVTDNLETGQVNEKLSESDSGINQNKTNNDVKRETKHVLIASDKKPSGVYQFIEEKQRISLSKERRAARTLGIIMGVFVVCWLPFFVMYVILPFCPSCCPTNKLINFITWLGYINSTLNPLIYTIFNLDYRRAFKKLLGLSK